MFAFYVTGLQQPGTDPFDVAAVVHEAYATAEPQLRWVCGWGAAESIDGRARMSDADWIALGAIDADDDAAYYARFRSCSASTSRHRPTTDRRLHLA